MAHLLTGDDKFREESSGDYRFARTYAKRGNRMRSVLQRVNGYLKTMIEAIADSKVRRMQRDLALRGIHFDPHGNNWGVRDSVPREHWR
ncbi:hypothetical protein V1283_005705 [Bradyrhizobium sp. AZCC 2262]|uniref:hypothetical protein n=1 Tax=Bradyrhizobium sp. AZCC 2262 TaxID=3117022 RepID=UPI002FF2138B